MNNKIIQGDCLEVLKTLPSESVDAVITDPPYHLVSIVKRFGKEGSAPAKEGTDGSFKRLSGGFMGKTWDGVDENGMGIAMNVDMWKECLRVLKPGGHLLSFGGTRTYHRMASAIEDAGFEIRDMIEWVYGSGFPKSLNIGKAVDKLQGNEREFIGNQGKMNGRNIKNHKKEHEILGGVNGWDKDITKGTSEWEGWGTALKPSHEPICMARKPLAEKTVAENCLKWGTGGINIDESRVEYQNKQDSDATLRANTPNSGRYKQTGGVNIVLPAIKENYDPSKGRFPANLIHDNSEEVRECFPETKSGKLKSDCYEKDRENNSMFAGGENFTHKGYEADSGNASRFFKSIIYQAKASKSERNMGCEDMEEVIHNDGRDESLDSGHMPQNRSNTPKKNFHPTVKPIALMEYLINMVTREGQTVLDPFAGSGTTLIAAKKLGRKYIGIELEPEYVKIAEARLISIKERLL